ncbi:MAG: hypothetical protein JWO82_435, partial [Akkermansiaceae bacterium]|nr:hypothetical protein [Akkermansiaceae bacterium]
MNDPAPPLPSEDPPNRSVAGLRIFGDDLEPDEITSLLGHPPSDSYRRGDTRTIKATGHVLTRKTSYWGLKAPEGHGDLNVQVTAILDPLTTDLAVWKDLSSRYHIDIFCGFFMGES